MLYIHSYSLDFYGIHNDGSSLICKTSSSKSYIPSLCSPIFLSRPSTHCIFTYPCIYWYKMALKTFDGTGLFILLPSYSWLCSFCFLIPISSVHYVAYVSTVEVYALFFALKYILVIQPLYSLLIPLLQAFPSIPTPIVRNMQDWLFKFCQKKRETLHFCWVLSHVWIPGNE